MLFPNGDGTYTAGPLDVMVILQDVNTRRYHVCFLEEHPFPGPLHETEEAHPVRLMSRMHHTGGADDFAQAQKQLDELRTKLTLMDENVDRDQVHLWNGQQGIVWLVDNWRAGCKIGEKSPAFSTVKYGISPEQAKEGAACSATP
jgi:hypothetical protein